MRHSVRGEDHVFVLEKRPAEKVAEGVVFFVEGEGGGVRGAGVGCGGDLFFVVAEEEELETGRR